MVIFGINMIPSIDRVQAVIQWLLSVVIKKRYFHCDFRWLQQSKWDHIHWIVAEHRWIAVLCVLMIHCSLSMIFVVSEVEIAFSDHIPSSLPSAVLIAIWEFDWVPELWSIDRALESRDWLKCNFPVWCFGVHRNLRGLHWCSERCAVIGHRTHVRWEWWSSDGIHPQLCQSNTGSARPWDIEKGKRGIEIVTIQCHAVVICLSEMENAKFFQHGAIYRDCRYTHSMYWIVNLKEIVQFFVISMW